MTESPDLYPSSPTEPPREQGKEAQRPLYLKIKSGSGAKLPEENTDSEVKSEVQPTPRYARERKSATHFSQGTRVFGGSKIQNQEVHCPKQKPGRQFS